MKRTRDEGEKKEKEEEEEESAGDEEEEKSESISLEPDDEEEEGEEPQSKRPRPQAIKPKANALLRLEEFSWGDDRPKFAKNLVSNMFRLSKIVRQATHLAAGRPVAAQEGHEESIEFSKDVHEPILQYFTENLEVMLEGAKDIQNLRDRQRLSAEDLRATIERDPRFRPFRVDELLVSSGQMAPALTTVLNTLSVGKGAGRMSRILYEHLLEDSS